ncbi:MAG: glycosyltransferase family 4 protein [Acidobacteria bacterium]|nr:glycosyltransferase family 4 protein [Acidobacteriota bacterium]
MSTATIRVVRLIARLNIGGPAIHATLLHERLNPARFESTLVTGTEEAGEGNYLELHGRTAKVEVIPDLGREIRPLRDVQTLSRLVSLMRRIRPHVVHTHTAKAGAVGRAAAILAGVPAVVHTYHGHVLRGYFSPAKTAVYRGIEQSLAWKTDRLLAVTTRVRDELIALGVGKASQYRAVPLGFDLVPLLAAERRRGELRAELGVGDAPLIGIVARLVPIKAHEVFLAAAAEVRRQVPGARFLIVGDGELRQTLELQTAALGLTAAVRFLGWRADIDRLYADIDVMALTSRNEGSPVALIEAMAAGVPVVSTDVGGVADVVEHGVSGLLAPMDDAAAVARHVVTLLADPAMRRTMGQHGRTKVAATYDAGRLVTDIETLYEDLIREKQIRL